MANGGSGQDRGEQREALGGRRELLPGAGGLSLSAGLGSSFLVGVSGDGREEEAEA